jgi:hypothetical protein
MIATAGGLDPNTSLDVGVRLNKKDVGHWLVEGGFQMRAFVLEAGALKAGENLIEFTTPPAVGDKKPLLQVESLFVTPLVSRGEVSLAELGAQGNLISGIYGKEGEGKNASTWSAGLRTKLGLLLGPLNTDYDLELEGYAFGPLQPLDVEAMVNGKAVGRARVDKGPRYVFHAPPGAFRAGLNVVEFVYAKVAKPSDSIKGSSDKRELAIRIVRVSATPAATALQ